MSGAVWNPSRWTRRRAVSQIGTLIWLAPALVPSVASAQSERDILLVSRKRLLNDTAHAKALFRAERALTAELQRRVDAVKAELAAEEEELTRLRRTLDRASFEARVAEFDSKVRRERREAQQHAANLQNAFRAERLKLVDALEPLLTEVRAAYGASLILNADQVLIADPAIDVTNDVIARFNATVPPPEIPELDALAPPSEAESGQDDEPQPAE